MTSERNFDRLARAWLALGPETPPHDAVAAVLRAAATTPQARRRAAWLPLGVAPMRRLSFITAGLTILALVAGGVLISQFAGPGSPTPTPTPSASTSSIPASLIGTWGGGPRPLPGQDPSVAIQMTFNEATVSFIVRQLDTDPRIAQARSSGPGRLQLRNDAGCPGNPVGDYAWQLSDSGRQLTITAMADACADRLAAFTGQWFRMGCQAGGFGGDCLGDLDAGTYGTQNIDVHHKVGVDWLPRYGAIGYTVPDGWANSADWFTSFWLRPSADYALETPDGPAGGAWSGISIWNFSVLIDPPVGCGLPGDDRAPSVDSLLERFAAAPALTASQPVDITIDGRQGRWIDVEISADWTGNCPLGAGPAATPEAFGRFLPTPGPWAFGPVPGERTRLIVLDIGEGDVVIAIDAGDGSKFDGLVEEAMPIVESLTFRLDS